MLVSPNRGGCVSLLLCHDFEDSYEVGDVHLTVAVEVCFGIVAVACHHFEHSYCVGDVHLVVAVEVTVESGSASLDDEVEVVGISILQDVFAIDDVAGVGADVACAVGVLLAFSEYEGVASLGNLAAAYDNRTFVNPLVSVGAVYAACGLRIFSEACSEGRDEDFFGFLFFCVEAVGIAYYEKNGLSGFCLLNLVESIVRKIGNRFILFSEGTLISKDLGTLNSECCGIAHEYHAVGLDVHLVAFEGVGTVEVAFVDSLDVEGAA